MIFIETELIVASKEDEVRRHPTIEGSHIELFIVTVFVKGGGMAKLAFLEKEGRDKAYNKLAGKIEKNGKTYRLQE